MPTTDVSVSHNKKQSEKIKSNIVAKKLKLRGSMNTKDLAKENKLLKEELEKAQRTIKGTSHREVEHVKNGCCIKEIFSLLPGNVYWKSRDHVYTMCNTGEAKVLGLKSHEEIEGKKDTEVLDKKYVQWIRTVDEEVMRNDEKRVLEEVGHDANGNPATYLSTKHPLHGEKGEVIGLVGISFDITERKKYEALLQDEKEQAEQAQKITADFIAKMRYEITGQKNGVHNVEQSAQEIRDYLEHIISLIPGNIYWKDRLGRYLFWNEHALKIMGLKSYKDIVGKMACELFDKGLAELTTVADEHVMESDQIVTAEEKGLDVDGNDAIYLTRKIPLHDLNGKVIGLLGVSLDITDRKKAENLEKENAILARKTAEFMKLLSGTMSHELCTPLRIIDTQASVIRRSLPMLVEGYEAAANASLPIPPLPRPIKVKNLEESTDKICDEVNSIFATIGILLNKGNLPKFDEKTFEQLSINNCISLTMMRYPFEEHEKLLVVWPDESAKDAIKDFAFKGSNLLTMHMIFNLLKNALGSIKEAGKGKIYMWLTADDKFNYLHFKDTAKGMSPETAAHVFDYLFTQSKNGTGIGLTFVKTVMENFNGDISCNATENEFAEFVLKFPRIQA